MKLIKFFTSIWNWFVGLFGSKKVEEVVEEGKLVTIAELDKELHWSERTKVDGIIKVEVDTTPIPEPREDYINNDMNLDYDLTTEQILEKLKHHPQDLGTIELETEVIVTDADMKALEATGRLEQFEKDYGPKIPIVIPTDHEELQRMNINKKFSQVNDQARIGMDILPGTPFEKPATISFEVAKEGVEQTTPKQHKLLFKDKEVNTEETKLGKNNTSFEITLDAKDFPNGDSKPKRRYNKRKSKPGSMTEKPKVTKEETQVKAEQAVATVKPKKRRNYKKKNNEKSTN